MSNFPDADIVFSKIKQLSCGYIILHAGHQIGIYEEFAQSVNILQLVQKQIKVF